MKLSIVAFATLAVLGSSLELAEIEQRRTNSKLLLRFFNFMMNEGLVSKIGTFVGGCKQISQAWKDENCESRSVDCIFSGPFEPCCGDELGEKALQCSDTRGSWRESLGIKVNLLPSFRDDGGLKDFEDCCDHCLDENDPTCSPETFVGASVCGTDIADGDKVTYFPGRPIGTRKDCSTGPTHDSNGVEEEDGSEFCNAGTENEFLAIFDQYKSDPSAFESDLKAFDINKPLHAKMRTLSKGLDFARAAVTSSEDATFPAKFSMSSGSVDGNRCMTYSLEPFVDGEIEMGPQGSGYTSNPTVYPRGKLTIFGTMNAWVVGGKNEGNLDSTTTGYLFAHGVENSGDLSINGASQVFLSDIVNNGGNANIKNVVAGSGINILNNGGNVKVEDSTFDLHSIVSSGDLTAISSTGSFSDITNNGGTALFQDCNGVAKSVNNVGGDVTIIGGSFKAEGIENNEGGTINIQGAELDVEIVQNTGTINIDVFSFGRISIPSNLASSLTIHEHAKVQVILTEPTAIPCSSHKTLSICRKNKCRWFKKKCSTIPTRKPTQFPTSFPTKSPTVFSCGDFKSKLFCNARSKKRCLWSSGKCLLKTSKPTSSPTTFSCDNFKTKFVCNVRSKKRCIWSGNSCSLKTTSPTSAPTPRSCENDVAKLCSVMNLSVCRKAKGICAWKNRKCSVIL